MLSGKAMRRMNAVRRRPAAGSQLSPAVAVNGVLVAPAVGEHRSLLIV